ncbi:MAG: WecB/TagA/CpsF family glycosyltransferase [Candidatus Falkowbacteria bacterium]
MKKIKIMGVNLAVLPVPEVYQIIGHFLLSRRARQIVTPNPEILLEAEHNDEYAYALNGANLAVPDGFGLSIAGWVKGARLSRVPGSDLVPYIIKKGGELGLRQAAISWRGGLSSAEQIKAVLNKMAPGSRVRIFELERGEDLPVEYFDFDPQVVLVSLGAPWQDILAARLRDEGRSLRLVMGVGGSFDFLTGLAKRSPRILRSIGLEWLWRLVRYPRARTKRVLRAVIVFPLHFIIRDFINKYFYRPNVVGFIYDRQGRVLLLNSNKEPRDFWKLPQGGIEAGESPQQAVLREMSEELGVTNFKLHACYRHVFKYRWPKHYDLGGYKGQQQSLCLLEYLGQPDDIKLSAENKDYKWVPMDRLLQEADPVTKMAYTKFRDLFHNYSQKIKQ